MEDDNTEVEVMIECPRPKDGLWGDGPFDQELATAKGDWAKYWLKKFKTAYDNAVNSQTIQPKEILFPGTQYVTPTGDLKEVEEKEYREMT